MKIVILNGASSNPGDLPWDMFIANHPSIEIYSHVSTEKETIEKIHDAEIVLAPGVKFTPALMETDPKLRYIGMMSTGYDLVDTAYCSQHGITVTNIPTYGTQMVSQFAFALLLEICCRVGHHSGAVHEGRWMASGRRMFWDYPIIELQGKTMGVIGFGRIGKTTAMLGQAFNMQVVYYDKYRALDYETATCRYMPLGELLAISDVIFLHSLLSEETYHLINAASIRKMKDGVILINNARGALIEEQSLVDALRSGKIYAAGLDTVENEPIPDTSPLLKAPNCYITPHISWVSRESRLRLLHTAAQNLDSYLAGKPENVVV